MFYITKWTQQSRPETAADKRKENINLLFYDNYRGDEALLCRMRITRAGQISVD